MYFAWTSRHTQPYDISAGRSTIVAGSCNYQAHCLVLISFIRKDLDSSEFVLLRLGRDRVCEGTCPATCRYMIALLTGRISMAMAKLRLAVSTRKWLHRTKRRAVLSVDAAAYWPALPQPLAAPMHDGNRSDDAEHCANASVEHGPTPSHPACTAKACVMSHKHAARSMTSIESDDA